MRGYRYGLPFARHTCRAAFFLNALLFFGLAQSVYAAAPVIQSQTIPANATYVVGEHLDFTVTWDQSVTVTGTPGISVILSVGGPVSANYVSGSGTPTLLFRYTIVSGNNDNDGIIVDSSITLAGGTIQNAGHENAAVTGIIFGSTANIFVDGIAPTVTSVTVPADGTYGLGQNMDFVVHFSENVIVDTSIGNPYLFLTLDSGFQFLNYMGIGSGTNALTFRYTVPANKYDTDGIVLGGSMALNMGTIRDAAGNNIDTTLNGVPSTTGILVDTYPPSVNSIERVGSSSTHASSVDFTVTFSESVIHVDATDFSLQTTGSVSGSISASIAGSGSVYTVTVNGITGEGTLRLDLNPFTDIVDASDNGNSSGYSGGQVYTIDATAPTVSSIARLNPVGPSTTLSSVIYRVTFSESISGLDVNDFNLVSTGTATGSIASVSAANGNAIDVTINAISGDGTLGLNLKSSGTGIADAAANPISGGFTGEVYTINHGIDVRASISNGATYLRGGTPVDYTITIVNNGPNPATGVAIVFSPPAAFTGVSWSCLGAGTAACPNDSGTGAIGETANLPSGGSLTYLVHGDIPASPEATISATVTVAPPSSVNDLSASDNSATDTDPVGIFINGFE